MAAVAKKLSAGELAELAISMTDDLVAHIRQMNGNTHTVTEMMNDLWEHRENTPFVVTVYEAIQEVKPDGLGAIGRKAVES